MKGLCPGTLQRCTTCACHRQHYLGSKYGDEAFKDKQGWFYCDRFVEGCEIHAPTEAYCHWYTPGQTTHRTPQGGVRQALWLGWTPGPVDSPNSKPKPEWADKLKAIEEVKKAFNV